MQSKQTKKFQVDEPIEKVWRFLSDPRKVAPCLPGAQITETIDDRTYKGIITVKIGPVSTQFKGLMKVERLDPENHELELSGTGQDPRGGGGASMKMIGKLTALSPSQTEVTGTVESSVTGRLAQFGARMMDDVSNHLFNQFTKSLQAKLAEEGTEGSKVNPTAETQSEEAEPIKALPLLWNVVKDKLKK